MTKLIKTRFGEIKICDVTLNLNGSTLDNGISLSLNEDVFAEIIGCSAAEFGEFEDLVLLEDLIKKYI